MHSHPAITQEVENLGSRRADLVISYRKEPESPPGTIRPPTAHSGWLEDIHSHEACSSNALDVYRQDFQVCTCLQPYACPQYDREILGPERALNHRPISGSWSCQCSIPRRFTPASPSVTKCSAPWYLALLVSTSFNSELPMLVRTVAIESYI